MLAWSLLPEFESDSSYYKTHLFLIASAFFNIFMNYAKRSSEDSLTSDRTLRDLDLDSISGCSISAFFNNTTNKL